MVVAEREDHLPIILMTTPWTLGLMIARPDLDLAMMIDTNAAAAEIAWIDEAIVGVEVEVEAEALAGEEIGRNTARSRDMHRREGEGATLLLCPHLLRSDAGWLTLLRTSEAGNYPRHQTRLRRTHSRQMRGLKRWVAIHSVPTLLGGYSLFLYYGVFILVLCEC